MKSTAPHIVQYQGSKRKLAPLILQYFPHKFNRLIEPFAGMAAVSIATAQEERCQKFIINDINAPLLSLLKEAILNPAALVEGYTEIWEEQFNFPSGHENHYYYIREKFNKGQQDAPTMLYLLARCVKGAVRYGSNGNFNQSPDKRRNGTNPLKLAQNVARISRLLKGKVIFESSDYRDVLANVQKGDIVYMDPPYQGVCTRRDSRYFSGIVFNEFVDALYSLNSRNIDYVISYDGFCGEKEYGEDLPRDLGLKKLYLDAGISTQSLFNGQKLITKEALYLSPNMVGK